MALSSRMRTPQAIRERAKNTARICITLVRQLLLITNPENQA